MYNLTDIQTIKNLMQTNSSKFKKSLGQNFLVDETVCPQMAQLCGASSNDGVLEIGPGIGVLTTELANVAKKVVCYETDKSLKPILDKTLAEFDNIDIIYEDFMKCDLKNLADNRFADVDNIFVCANLPYYITSPILMKLLEENPGFSAITLMVQKEAGVRLCAEIGTRDAGAVSVSVERYAKREMLFNVDRSSFFPSPNVDSCVVKFTLRTNEEKYDIKNEKLFNRMIKAGFCQRRKTLLNSLSSNMGLPKEQTEKIIGNAGIDKKTRIEALNMNELIALCNGFDTSIKLDK